MTNYNKIIKCELRIILNKKLTNFKIYNFRDSVINDYIICLEFKDVFTIKKQLCKS